MAFWIFRRRQTAAPQLPAAPAPDLVGTLLKAFIDADLTRQTKAVEIDAKRQDMELKKLELEMDHIAAIAEEKRKDAEHREKIRAARQAAAENARNQRKNGRYGAKPRGVEAPPFMATCEECSARIQNRRPRHTEDMLRHATQGHEKALSDFQAGNPNASSTIN